jgi:hypothetical protein
MCGCSGSGDAIAEFRVVQRAGLEHRNERGRQAVGYTAECTPVTLVVFSEFGVVFAKCTRRIER